MAPDPSKIESGEPQDEFVARSWWEALFGRLLERCCVVFECAQKARDMRKTCKNLGKTMVFTHRKLLPRTSVQARNNAEKITLLTPKTVPGPFRNPPKSTPEARKSTPERCKTRKNQPRATTNAAESTKCAQDAHKSTQRPPQERPRAPKRPKT